MSAKNNVVDFTARLKKKNNQGPKTSHEDAKKALAKGESSKKKPSKASVIDMSERRREEIDAERRLVTRTVLSHIVGVIAVIPNQGLQPVSLYDVSEGGLSFDMRMEAGSFSVGETVTMRMYLSHDTYFAFAVKIANIRSLEGEGVNRHGVVLDTTHAAYKTMSYFTRFLEQVSQVAKKDEGERVLGRID